MTTELARRETGIAAEQGGGFVLPAVIADAGERAGKRFLEFFTANIRNPNTRQAYARAVARFLEWCDNRHIGLLQIEPLLVAAYIEELCGTHSRPTVKQHLAAIKMLFDWLTSGGVIPFSPAASVRGPKHVVKKGTTPVLKTDEARTLLNSIKVVKKKGQKEVPDIKGLRDRALIAVMVYSFARVGATLAMRVEDYYTEGRRGLVPAAREGREAPQRPRPPQRGSLSRRLHRGRRHRPGPQGDALPDHRQDPQAHEPADGPQRRPSDDQAKGRGGRALAGRVLSHVPCDGYNGLPGKRGDHREGPANRRPRVAQDDQALRPDLGCDIAR